MHAELKYIYIHNFEQVLACSLDSLAPHIIHIDADDVSVKAWHTFPYIIVRIILCFTL